MITIPVYLIIVRVVAIDLRYYFFVFVESSWRSAAFFLTFVWLWVTAWSLRRRAVTSTEATALPVSEETTKKCLPRNNCMKN
jgi:hypothetical protein